MIFGITGGIACGKSLAGSILESMGFEVCDTDRLAHRLMEPGQPVFEAVIREFGPQVLGADGKIDRTKLGAIVFGDEQARLKLNELTHPAVFDAVRALIARWRCAGQDGAVLIPLLHECGEDCGWDEVVCIAADEAVMKERLRERGLTDRAAAARIAAQMDLPEKIRRSDHVIRNNGTIQEFEKEIGALVACCRNHKES